MNYETVIGLEVHVELATESKLFCACSAKFTRDANRHVCPACAGMPGMPAVLNKKAVELAIAAGLVTNCEIARLMTFDKKNYFYPDLPAGYQITQYYAPVCTNGRVTINTGAGTKVIRVKQIHIEEDAGKLMHDNRIGASLVDFNRTSVPLVEIVSRADFNNAEEVVAYLEKLRSLLSFAGVSDCRMQEGSMRCDVNISVREKGSDTLGVRAEIKNMNSLKAITAAIAYETKRHTDALEHGTETLVQQTRRWDDEAGETFAMREKENAQDYLYYPNPEVMPVYIDDAWIEAVRNSLPEPADLKYARLTGETGLSEYNAKIITNVKNLSGIFDETLKYYDKPRDAANWIITELLAAARNAGNSADDIKIDAQKFAKIIEMVETRVIGRAAGRQILEETLTNGADPEKYAIEHNLLIAGDGDAVLGAVKAVIDEQRKSAEDYRNGNQKAFGFLVGQVMKRLGGKADPRDVNQILAEELRKID